jgi:RNA polymerase sigma-70 factor, ECF subfamily
VLPPAQRVAVVLVDVQGWSVAEVAELLEVPVGTVKSRCARARVRLAALLGHLRTEEPG